MSLFSTASQRLSDLRQALNPQAALQGMLKQFMPALLEQMPAAIPQLEAQALQHFSQVEKPIIEGGLLQEGQEMIIYTVSRVEDKIFIAQCAAKITDNQMVCNAPIFALPADEFAKMLIEAFKNAQNMPTDGE